MTRKETMMNPAMSPPLRLSNTLICDTVDVDIPNGSAALQRSDTSSGAGQYHCGHLFSIKSRGLSSVVDGFKKVSCVRWAIWCLSWRSFVSLTLAIGGLYALPISAQTSSSSPNILFVIADDFGLDASPCYSVGAEKPNMPTLEGLCKQGIVFDNAWAYPTCTPTRASILTGQYGIHTNVMQVDDVLAATPTILQAVSQKPSNYATAVIGKWHVGGQHADPNHPNQLGAQYYAGFLTGALRDYSSWDITINGKVQRESRYSTTVLTNHAVNWIGAQKQPWFLWLAYNAPHTPFHIPPDELHTQNSLRTGGAPNNRSMYFAAAEALDHELGRLLASLPEAVRRNTTVVFMGDNGTPQQVVQAPFSRSHAKSSLYEGGIHVPLVVAGAGVTRAGQREAALINSTDLFATFASLAEVKPNVPADSISFAGALSSTAFKGRSHAYMDFRQNGKIITAIRDARYKLLELEGGKRQLFDLLVDPYETKDLLGSSATPSAAAIADALTAQRTVLQK
jgi:arylsulfatase B